MSTIVADPARTDLEPPAKPSPGLMPTLRKLLKPVASLQLTVGLLALSVGLVFFGTLAQKTYGIWTVVDQYFWSWVVFIDAQPAVEFGKIFFGLPTDLQAPSWLKLPYPGGKSIGGLMFVNLLAAHFVRMKLTWKRTGVIVLHSGLVLLFVGEFITREFQVEQQMVIPEGGSANYAFDHRHAELAVVDSSDPKDDKVTVVSDGVLKRYAGTDEAFDHDLLPVSVQVVKWFPNSDLVSPSKPEAVNDADAGAGLKAIAEGRPEVTGVDPEQKADYPSAYVRLYEKGTDKPLGTYLVSVLVDSPQTVTVGGKTYELSLRFTRYYKPFRLHLDDFTFDRYPGTDTPKNYASQIQLEDPATGDRRAVTIAMNEPFRHAGETFYQSSFTKDEKSTILQVVRNPGWVLPYLSCVLVTVGLCIHFGMNLGAFLARTRLPRPTATAAPPRSVASRAIPLAAVAFTALYVSSTLMPRSGGKYDFAEAARLPVLDGGRVKPLDTVVRVDLRLLNHKESVTDPDGNVLASAMKWYFDTATMSGLDGPGMKHPVFRLENDRLIELVGQKRRYGLRYSLKEIGPKYDEIRTAARAANAKAPKDRDPFDAKALELWKHMTMHDNLWSGESPTILPPSNGNDWRTLADADAVVSGAVLAALPVGDRFRSLRQMKEAIASVKDKAQRDQLLEQLESLEANEREKDPEAAAWHGVLSAYKAGDADVFNRRVHEFRDKYAAAVPAADLRRVRFEAFINETAPYWTCLCLYVTAGVLVLVGWLATAFHPPAGEGFRRAAFWVLAGTVLLHTFALVSRMYLMDRPLVFVTNLYSSAVFIGWAAAGLCLVIERLFPIGLGNFVAAAVGIGTSIIAHNLAAGGDTLEMMQAVLDTNFWLATHVTTVTLGYSATYVAAVVGLVYVVLGVFTPLLGRPAAVGMSAQGRPAELGKVIATVAYGIICLATLFSFVGTVLGGIWADQSWGRFWGWDPKENGAVLIVAWNAMILHARWCGLVKDRGTAVLAVAGAVITTWSWFGTNQLGVGLHAYGFNNELVLVCDLVWAVSVTAMLLGLVPTRYWVSYAPPAAVAPRRV